MKVRLNNGLFASFCFLLLATPFGVNREGCINGCSLSKAYSDSRQFVNNYINSNRKKLHSIQQKSQSPFAISDAVFTHYNLPLQLKYLAVIESELNPHAVSRVGAKGPWQLMSGTAKELGLKVDSAQDERTHYGKSTRAAALYLRDLYSQFGDWLLVLAAYNGGPGPVQRAIRRSGSRDFWALQAYLPAESRMHVKKFISTLYYFEGSGSVTVFTQTRPVQFASNRVAQTHTPVTVLSL